MILSNVLLFKKAKLLANILEIPEDTLKFSFRQLQNFKKCNRIHQEKLQKEAASIDQTIVTEALSLLYSKYPLEWIYNMNETGFFY